MIKICVTCQKEFEAKHDNQKYCSITCRNLQRQNKYVIICEYCHKEFHSSCMKKYCNRSCNTSARNKIWTLQKSWQRKYGDQWEEKYNEWRQKISIKTSGENNGMFNKQHTQEACLRIGSRTKGKTLEEIYGFEKAREMHDKQSRATSGENNPAFGKVYTNGGKSLKGYYKKIFFRSLLEYSFIKHLESQNVDIYNDVDYECFKVPYMNEKGTNRTYRIDFYVKSQQVVYEVKPSYVLKKIPLNQQLKWDAAKKFFLEKGIEFKIITEKDFQKITFNKALLDKDIEWNKKTFEYFKTNEETQKLIDELEKNE
jgi:hypothetical protein